MIEVNRRNSLFFPNSQLHDTQDPSWNIYLPLSFKI